MQKLRPWEVTQLASGRLEIQVHCWLQSLLFFIAPNCFQKSREELGRRRMVKLDRLASLLRWAHLPHTAWLFIFCDRSMRGYMEDIYRRWELQKPFIQVQLAVPPSSQLWFGVELQGNISPVQWVGHNHCVEIEKKLLLSSKDLWPFVQPLLLSHSYPCRL